MTAGERPAQRVYRSRVREEQARRTRRRVLEAATSAFLRLGYAGATMRTIAAEAGVSVPTVEQLFGTKAAVLKAAIDVAIAGDDEPVPVLERTWTRPALDADTADGFLAIVASVVTAAQFRSAGLVLAAFEAARNDPDLAALAERLSAQRQATAAWLIGALTRTATLRKEHSRQDAVEKLWILMDPAVYDRLVRHRHWSPEQYQAWFADSARRLLVPDAPPPRPHHDLEVHMSPSHRETARRPPRQGQIGYLQLPARDVASSAAFYAGVFGWSVDADHGSFTAPGMIGQLTTDVSPVGSGGPVAWICADSLAHTLDGVTAHGGAVRGRPWLDGGERWLAEIDDPAGNRLGVVVPARATSPQTMIAVRDVEASSRWYQQLLGLTSDHGGPHYERLLADGLLVLQLHHVDVEHHHGRIADPDRDVGNGVLLWFGEVADFDGVVERCARLRAPIVRAPHRNPPEGHGNGPAHREIWIRDPDGYTVVVASPDGEAFEPTQQFRAGPDPDGP